MLPRLNSTNLMDILRKFLGCRIIILPAHLDSNRQYLVFKEGQYAAKAEFYKFTGYFKKVSWV